MTTLVKTRQQNQSREDISYTQIMPGARVQ